MIALQWCVSFCRITKWISYTYTYSSPNGLKQQLHQEHVELAEGRRHTLTLKAVVPLLEVRPGCLARSGNQRTAKSSTTSCSLTQKCTVVVLLSHEKEWNNAICSNMDGPRDYHTKWSKSHRKRQISYDITSRGNVKTATHELNCKTEQSHTFRKHTMDAERERWGGVMHKTRVSN